MKERIARAATEVLAELEELRPLPPEALDLQLGPTRDPAHGDFATNLAMRLAGRLKTNPRQLADRLARALIERGGPWESVEVAGPGFLNFRLGPGAWQESLRELLAAGDGYGRVEKADGERVLIEFVSANPTGPMNVVSARAGAYGDSLARIMTAAGYRVATEFYVNDAGNQIRLYGASMKHHLGALLGKEYPLPEDGYQGEYLRDLAEGLRDGGEAWFESDSPELHRDLGQAAAKGTVAWQREDLDRYRISFDRWFHESELHRTGELEETLAELRERGAVYDCDGAVWLRTSEHGDSEDRVLIKSDGAPAYLLGDIAYHRNKLRRGFHRLIDVWGPDHHGHVIRMKAAMKALGIEPDRLELPIVQQVNLLAGGERVKMSKRTGEFVTLRELIDDVGVDPARFFFVQRRAESHLDFDLDLARRQSKENPVYYVQYVHARYHSLRRQADRAGLELSEGGTGALERLELPEELEIIKQLAQYPALVQAAADSREVHRIPYYLQELAGRFHNYYFGHRFIGDDPELSRARLKLAEAVASVVRSGLALLGIQAPESM